MLRLPLQHSQVQKVQNSEFQKDPCSYVLCSQPQTLYQSLTAAGAQQSPRGLLECWDFVRNFTSVSQLCSPFGSELLSHLHPPFGNELLKCSGPCNQLDGITLFRCNADGFWTTQPPNPEILEVFRQCPSDPGEKEKGNAGHVEPWQQVWASSNHQSSLQLSFHQRPGTAASPSITIPPPQLCPSCHRCSEWFTLRTEGKGVGGTHAYLKPLAWCRKWGTLELVRTRLVSQNVCVGEKKKGVVRNPCPEGTNEYSRVLWRRKYKGIPRATGIEVRIWN